MTRPNNSLIRWLITLLLLQSVIQSSAMGEQAPSAGCEKSPTKVACFSCFNNWNKQVLALCYDSSSLKEYSLDSAKDALTNYQTCAQTNGLKNQNLIEAICQRIQAPQSKVWAITGESNSVTSETSSDNGEAAGDKDAPNLASKSSLAKSADRQNGSSPKTNATSAAQKHLPSNSQTVSQDSSVNRVGTPTHSNQSTTESPPADISSCLIANRTAVSCCNNPDNCLTSSEQSQVATANAQVASALQSSKGQSLNSLQQTTQNSQASAARVNNIYAAACFRSKATCLDSCQAAAQQSLDAQTGSQVSSAQNSCNRLSASNFATQSLNNAQASDMSGLGSQATQAGQQTGAGATDSYGNPSAPNSLGIATQAQTQTTQTTQAEQGSVQFETATNTPPKFALPDSGNLTPQASVAQGQIAEPAKINTIPNGGGGGFGGAGGSSQATLGNNVNQAAGPTGATVSTDIFQGLRSGGGYTASANPSNGESGSDGGRGLTATNRRRPSNTGDDSGYKGLDLKQYLPGGAYNRTRVGGNGERSEINAKEENIWEHISRKFYEKCRLGELYQCY